MIKIKNRAWFLTRDYNKPRTLRVMYDQEKNKPWSANIDLCACKVLDLKKVGTIFFRVDKSKMATRENILKWDFLSNSTDLPLVNDKALKFLEENVPGGFQIIPVKIVMPDGGVITDYKFPNVINKAPMFNSEKSVLSKNQPSFKTDYRDYDVYYYNLYGLGEYNIAGDNKRPGFFASEELRQAFKKSGLKGLGFRDNFGSNYGFLHEK